MDLKLNDEERAFRREVRTFVKTSLPNDIGAKVVSGTPLAKIDYVRWTRILHEKGWAVPQWPVEFGGTGWSPVKQYIFIEETNQAPAPLPPAFGTRLVAPVIYTFGTEEQKRRFLPRIATLEDWWCQGFSEPGAGSDLASLTTRAVRDGDHFIVDGQKTWTTLAQYANWIFCLVRTAPHARKQSGISFLLIDMKSPGITVRPIRLIDGGSEVNEVFFDNVSVPTENLVGEENHGWDYAKFLLGAERVNIARVGVSKERVRHIRAMAARRMEHGKALIEQPAFLERLTALEVRLKALEISQLRAIANEAKLGPGVPDPAAMVLKILGSEIQQATSELLLDVAGPLALQFRPGSRDDSDGDIDIVTRSYDTAAANYFNLRKVSIYGGTNEIQKSIISKAVLGL